LLLVGQEKVSAQTMYVTEKSGTQTEFTLNNVRKMTFSGGNITVQKTDNSTNVYSFNSVRYLNFANATTDIIGQSVYVNQQSIWAYPNPVSNLLTVDLPGLTSDGIIDILTLEGKVLQEQTMTGTNRTTLNLSQLPQGSYLCRYRNAEEVQIVKIIKR
jgi:hypothetical protein